MSQHWPSINSSKRTDDSTRRSTAKINKLRLSLGLSSPKSITNLKSTPNHFVSTSVVSSLSSVYRGLPDRYLSGSQSKRSLPSSSSVTKKCTYRLDAAVLIVSRIKKFIYKHFNIWKLSVGRYLAVERRNHSTKSLVIQVTVSREKKRFHSISKNSGDSQYSESPKSSGKLSLQSQPQIRLTAPKKEPELRTEKKNFDLGSQKTFCQKKMFKSFGYEEKVFSKFSFESGPVKPFARNKGYGDLVGMRRKAQKVFDVLERRYKKNMEDCFFTIMALFVFKLNFLKILVKLTRDLKLRMGVFVEDILGFAGNVDRGLRVCRVLKSVGRGQMRESFRKIVFFQNFNQRKSVRDSCEIFKKSIREITNSRARLERLRNTKDFKYSTSRNFQDLIYSATKNSIKSVQRLVLELVCRAGSEVVVQRKSEDSNKSLIEFTNLLKKKNSERNDARVRKVLKKLEKNIMKETRFRCRKCFEHWKLTINLVNGKDIYCLKTQTVFNIFKGIFCGNLKFALGSIRMYRTHQVKSMKSGFKAKLLKAVKRISKHLNFFKAKAFQKFKCYRHKTQTKRLESKQVTISQFVKILKGKVWKNFRYFYTKASQI